jgi:D-alanyl-D-alanine dipeptidase
VYGRAACYLRPTVAAALARVQQDLRRRGLGLKVFDCYRPLSVQRRFWELVPDERYVANPAKGSRHNRGAAVDLTLVDRQGRELKMPTGFDDFSPRAHRDYRDLPKAVIRNRDTLERAMRRRGFVGLPTEWWHFDFQGWERFEVLDLPFEELSPPR